MICCRSSILIVSLVLVCLTADQAVAQFTQVGNKLVGTGAFGASQQGYSVAVSSNGSTAIVGAPRDSNDCGAAWVYTWTGSVWSQQGTKLVATDAIGFAQQGTSVSLSGDGNTAIVGGALDNNFIGAIGAAWIYARTGGVWTKRAKLVGTGVEGGNSAQGNVAISTDGNTAIVGGPTDNGNTGAAWVFARDGANWNQQAKLVGTGAANIAWQGYSVALSADGSTAIVGGPWDSSYTGAAWIFTRAGTSWSQQARLVGTGVWYAAQQGTSVALSADGNTALVGGPSDSNAIGAVWVFTRSAGIWKQQGSKLVVSGSPSIFVGLGSSVAISADGNTALLGGWTDNSSAGAAFIFTRTGDTWTQQGQKLAGTGLIGASRVASSASLSGDGAVAILGGPQDNQQAGAAWIFKGAASAVKGPTEGTPLRAGLAQNFPNPFNPTTVVRFQLPVASVVGLAVYDMLGREVAVLVNERKEPGSYEVKFDGSGSPSGMYLYRLQAGSYVESRNMILLK